MDFQIENGRIIFVREVYGGKLSLKVGLEGDPSYLVSLQQGVPGTQRISSPASPKLVNLEVRLPHDVIRRKVVLKVIEGAQSKLDLSHYTTVIEAGGRGLGSKEKFQIIHDLAQALGAAVGATRPVIDNGWLPKEHQIESSGYSVSPRLYIACGISGAVQHLVGMTKSDCIVAINGDPMAPIFKVADYEIVGDVFRVVPELIELAKKFRN